MGQAKADGSTRFCMGAAWRDTKGRKTQFQHILDNVSAIRLGLDTIACGRQKTKDNRQKTKE